MDTKEEVMTCWLQLASRSAGPSIHPKQSTMSINNSSAGRNMRVTFTAAAFVLALSLLSVVPVCNAFVAPSFVRAVRPTSGKSAAFRPEGHVLHMADGPSGSDGQSKLPMLLDPGTKGGALFLSIILFAVPLLIKPIITGVLGVDELEAGKWIGVGFTFVVLVGWVGSYIFRVATKDMTYAKQLKDYENAVIAKRLEELDEDEVQALVEDIERDDF